MPDIVLTCQNCQNPFVYSEMEQITHQKQLLSQPTFCQICAAIKLAESKHPPKPKS